MQEVARRLGYRPNRIARALPSGRTRMLALLVPDITNPHHFGLIRGAEAQARAAGYTLVLGDTRGDAGAGGRPLRPAGLGGGRVRAGAPAGCPDAELRALRGRRPVVLYNRELAGFPSVVTDSDDGSRQIVEHLVALGPPPLAYLAGPGDAWTDGQRWAALSPARRRRPGSSMRAARPVRAHPRRTGRGGGRRRAGQRGDRAGGVQRPAGHRRAAPAGAAAACRCRARSAWSGFDDIFGADFCHPPLTTVASPAEEAGRALVDVLLDDRSPDPERIVLPVRLQVRQSTGPAPPTSPL